MSNQRYSPEFKDEAVHESGATPVNWNECQSAASLSATRPSMLL